MLPYHTYVSERDKTRRIMTGEPSVEETQLMGEKNVWIGQALRKGVILIVPGSHRPEQNQRDELKKSSDNILVLENKSQARDISQQEG